MCRPSFFHQKEQSPQDCLVTRITIYLELLTRYSQIEFFQRRQIHANLCPLSLPKGILISLWNMKKIEPAAVPHECSKNLKCCCYSRHMSFESAANKQRLENTLRNNYRLITRFQKIQRILFYSMCHSSLSVQYNAT